jgi:hypothetical protein
LAGRHTRIFATVLPAFSGFLRLHIKKIKPKWDWLQLRGMTGKT